MAGGGRYAVGLFHGRSVWLRGKARHVVDHPWIVLVHSPDMSARTAVVPEVRVRCILSYVRQIGARILLAARWAIRNCRHGLRRDLRSVKAGAVSGKSPIFVVRAQRAGLLHGRGLWLLGKWRDVADHRGLLLVDAPEMSTRTAVVREVRKLTCVRQVDGGGLVASGTIWDRRHRRQGDPPSLTAGAVSGNACAASGEFPTHGQVLHLLDGRVVQLVWNWCDVLDQLPGLLVHAPDVGALGTAVVVNARAVAQGRQTPTQRTVTRGTVRDRGHGWGTAIIIHPER